MTQSGISSAPKEFRQHIRLTAPFLPGTALATGVAIEKTISVAGARHFRFRLLADVDGSLEILFMQPKGGEAYAQNQPDALPIVADVEGIYDWQDHAGEDAVTVKFTPAADGELQYCDFSQGV